MKTKLGIKNSVLKICLKLLILFLWFCSTQNYVSFERFLRSETHQSFTRPNYIERPQNS